MKKIIGISTASSGWVHVPGGFSDSDLYLKYICKFECAKHVLFEKNAIGV